MSVLCECFMWVFYVSVVCGYFMWVFYVDLDLFEQCESLVKWI